MTQEDKELLLKELGARLPYGTEISLTDRTSGMITSISTVPNGTFVTVYFDRDNIKDVSIEDIKPYLRPMLSMTEEEKKEFESLGWIVDELDDNYPWTPYAYDVVEGIDWLSKKMFDYRGLIKKGLAIEAPEGMYNK